MSELSNKILKVISQDEEFLNNGVICEIINLLYHSFKENNQIIFPDGGYHPSTAVLDLLRLTVDNNVVCNGGDRFLDVTYKIAGCKVLSKEIKEKEKLDKTHCDVIYGRKE